MHFGGCMKSGEWLSLLLRGEPARDLWAGKRSLSTHLGRVFHHVVSLLTSLWVSLSQASPETRTAFWTSKTQSPLLVVNKCPTCISRPSCFSWGPEAHSLGLKEGFPAPSSPEEVPLGFVECFSPTQGNAFSCYGEKQKTKTKEKKMKQNEKKENETKYNFSVKWSVLTQGNSLWLPIPLSISDRKTE